MIYLFRILLLLTCIAGLSLQLLGVVTQQLDLPILMHLLLIFSYLYGIYTAQQDEVEV